MTVKILLGEGSDQHVIQENGRFNLGISSDFNEAGKVDTKEVLIGIEGDLVKSTPSAVWDDAVLKWNEIFSKLAARRVQIELNGVVKPEFDWTPDSTIAGTPQVRRFALKAGEGAGDSHWGFELEIYIKLLGNAGGGDMPNVYELATSIETKYQTDRPVYKIWQASAKAKDVATALSAIKNFKPSEKEISQVVKREFEANRVSAVWVWDGKRINRVRENIGVTGEGRHFEAETQVDTAQSHPVLYEAPLGAQTAQLDGELLGPTPALVAPGAHWSESETLKRQTALERNGKPVIFDTEEGLYKLEYQEIWIGTQGIPAPNHGDHQTIKKLSEPAD